VLTRDDMAACDGTDSPEGVVDSLRSVRDVAVAALVREQLEGVRTRVSLRSNGFDVGALARLRGGGGHRQAAGFSSDDTPEEVAAWLSTELGERL
jgi:phosphoesterase RecJ-like protein